MKRRIDSRPRERSHRKDDWRKRLDEARADAQDLEEAERIDQKLHDLLLSFLRGEISLQELRQRDAETVRERRGVLPIEDAASLEHILTTVLGDAELAEELTRHEVEHYEEAAEHGFPNLVYVIRFFKEEGRTSLRAGIEFDFPREGDEELIRQKLRQIIEAPEDPSDSDLCLME